MEPPFCGFAVLTVLVTGFVVVGPVVVGLLVVVVGVDDVAQLMSTIDRVIRIDPANHTKLLFTLFSSLSLLYFLAPFF